MGEEYIMKIVLSLHDVISGHPILGNVPIVLMIQYQSWSTFQDSDIQYEK